MLSYRNVLFYIDLRMYPVLEVARSVGINAYEAIMRYEMSPNGYDHLTSIGTIVIWTVRS